MIVTPVRPVRSKWKNFSFTSTLYLAPILDLLLDEVPSDWQPEIRLGLQEALVNAVKHGNALDPSKQISIKFSIVSQMYWWVITDQGNELKPSGCLGDDDPTPCHDLECGRGFYILRKIFDRVHWDSGAHRLTLGKLIERSIQKPIIE